MIHAPRPRTALLAALLLAAAVAAPRAGAQTSTAGGAPAAITTAFQPFAKLGILGGQYRYWSFSNGNNMRNPLVYWAPGWFHVQLEYWDFENTNSSDHFRPEIGLHLRDPRRSVYTLQWQHQLHQERWWMATDQVLGNHYVGRASFSAITTHDAPVEAANGGSPVWVIEFGEDYYWGSYNFASATLVRDPRQGGLWVVPMRVRLANERNDWFQATLSPASERSVGWAVDGKYHWLRLGIERNSRYDFTNVDNVIFTLGFEASLDQPR